jgi:hypothetical protein
MAVPINEALVQAIIKRRFGSVDHLVVEWEHRVATGVQKTGVARDRATIYRWLQAGLPSQTDDVFGFAAMLDVDPVALLSIDRKYVHEQFGRERHFFRLRRRRGTHLAPLWPIYAADTIWPNHELALMYYGRRWHMADFNHDPRRIADVYAAVLLQSAGPKDDTPRVFHFAFRRVGVSDRAWRPYGAVIASEEDIVLVSESGDYQKVARQKTPPVPVETHFGPGPADFRLVSIHPFDLTLEVPSRQQGCVRFGG